MIPVSIMFGTAIIIGNVLGEGRAQIAMQYYRHAVFLGFLSTFLMLFFYCYFKDGIIRGFTNQPEAIAIVERAWPVFLVFAFFDTIQLATSATIRATMNMGIGSILSFTGYFVIGIPLAWFFAFHQGMGITGIWIGPAFACIYLFILYNVVIARIDLKALIDTIEERTRFEKEVK